MPIKNVASLLLVMPLNEYGDSTAISRHHLRHKIINAMGGECISVSVYVCVGVCVCGGGGG